MSEVGSVFGYLVHIGKVGLIYYTNLYHIYHRNVPVSRTFEMQIEQFEAVD